MGTIVGNYEMIKQIGQGGFARTYLAKHLLLDEYACIKQNLDLGKDDTELLRREAKILWHIHHHSLPTLRDFIECDDGSFLMVMTYIEGKDMYKIVKEDYPQGIHPEHICWMAQRLLNALHYLHYYGVIHGDVKPHNIIVKPDEHNAILVDYGLSSLNPKAKTKPMGYTELFAAPEQIAGKPPLPETDIYSLGLTLIYALGGDITAKSLPRNVPEQLKDFILKMVVHDIHRRPKCAADLIKPLSNLRETLFGRRSSKRKLVIRT